MTEKKKDRSTITMPLSAYTVNRETGEVTCVFDDSKIDEVRDR